MIDNGNKCEGAVEIRCHQPAMRQNIWVAGGNQHCPATGDSVANCFSKKVHIAKK